MQVSACPPAVPQGSNRHIITRSATPRNNLADGLRPFDETTLVRENGTRQAALTRIRWQGLSFGEWGSAWGVLHWLSRTQRALGCRSVPHASIHSGGDGGEHGGCS